MDGKELLNFADKLEDDHKDEGYKWLYDKLRYEIIKKHQEAINFIPCCTKLNTDDKNKHFINGYRQGYSDAMEDSKK